MSSSTTAPPGAQPAAAPPPKPVVVRRPLLRPAPTRDVIYIKATTPFIAAVKRVDSALESQDSVTVKASGKAIGKALELGGFWIREGRKVEVRTGTVGAVDDVKVGKRRRDEEEKEEEEETRVRGVSFVEVVVSGVKGKGRT